MVAGLYPARHGSAIATPPALAAALDSAALYSYLQLIPINRFPAAHSCVRRFFACDGVTSEEMGVNSHCPWS
jgi:hypothetical protein